MKKTFKYFANKYVLALLALVLQLMIFESVDVFSLRHMKSKERNLREKVRYQKKQIEAMQESSSRLSDPKERERFAREHNYFKKPNETIFVITNE